MRFAISIVMGVVAALGLFLLMHGLISGTADRPESNLNSQSIDFIRVAPDEVTRQKERQKPKKPPPPKEPPPPPKMSVSKQDKPPPQPINMETPDISVSPSTGGGPFLGAFNPGDPAAEGDVIPIVRIQPQYPREALIEGITGWVEVEFTINEDGTVADPEVKNAEPKRIFNRAALRAILRWKFKPRVVDGVAIKRRASQIIEFQLEQG